MSARLLSFDELLRVHAAVLRHSGGGEGLRDRGALEAAVAAPRAGFDGQEFYPDLIAKACALAYSLIANHPFVDGNKRVGLTALDLMLEFGGLWLGGTVDDREGLILDVAAGRCGREEMERRVRALVLPRP